MSDIDTTMIILNINSYGQVYADGKNVKKGPCPDARDPSKKFVELVELVTNAFSDVHSKKIHVHPKFIEGAYSRVKGLYEEIQSVSEPQLERLKDFAHIKQGGQSKIQKAMTKLDEAYSRFQK